MALLSNLPACQKWLEHIIVTTAMKSVDMDMDMDGKFHIHGNPEKTCIPKIFIGLLEIFHIFY